MCVGMVTGLDNLVAVAIGRGERRMENVLADAPVREEIRDLIRSALLLASAVALIGGGLPVMIAFAPGLLPMVWLNVLRQFAVGMRRPGSLFRVTAVSIAVNALLNAVFIYGWLGLPELGLTGVGLSTTLVQARGLSWFISAPFNGTRT